jgi:hypothetical protein
MLRRRTWDLRLAVAAASLGLGACTKSPEEEALAATRQAYPHLQAQPETSYRCGDDDQTVATTSVLATEDTLISIEHLASMFRWNGIQRVWKWDDALAGMEAGNGSLFFLSADATNAETGIPFDFGFDGLAFGAICIGNLQTSGTFALPNEGLRLDKDAELTYPSQ